MDTQSPYSSPSFNPPNSGSPESRPGGVTAVAVLAIVLGGLGLMVTVGALVVLVVGLQSRSTMFGRFGQPGLPPAAQQEQQRMNADVQRVAERWRPYNLVALPAAILANAALIWGAIQVLTRRRAGRKLLIGALWAAGVIDLSNMWIGVPEQLEKIGIMENHMPRILAAQAEAMPAGAAEVMQQVLTVLLYLGVAVAAAWIVTKLVYYGVSIRYLRRPEIRTYVHQDTVTAELV